MELTITLNTKVPKLESNFNTSCSGIIKKPRSCGGELAIFLPPHRGCLGKVSPQRWTVKEMRVVKDLAMWTLELSVWIKMLFSGYGNIYTAVSEGEMLKSPSTFRWRFSFSLALSLTIDQACHKKEICLSSDFSVGTDHLWIPSKGKSLSAILDSGSRNHGFLLVQLPPVPSSQPHLYS